MAGSKAQDEVIICFSNQPSSIKAGLCSLITHQSLLDVAILCGNITLHAHKVFLAAASPYLREELEKVPSTEQIVMNGIDNITMKHILEYIYSGQVKILKDNMNFFLAVGKKFQLDGLVQLAGLHNTPDDSFNIPAPTFLTKKPKYPVAYVSPFTNHPNQNCHQMNANSIDANFRKVKKGKNKIDQEMDKAIAREAAASKLTVANLRKQLGPGNTMDSYDLEPSCTITTVENYIPSNDEEVYINELNNGQVEMVDYDFNKPEVITDMIPFEGAQNSVVTNGYIPLDMTKEENQTINGIKNSLGADKNRVEIFYRSNEGQIMEIDDEMLKDLSTNNIRMAVVNIDHNNAGASTERLVSPENFQHFDFLGDDMGFNGFPGFNQERSNHFGQSEDDFLGDIDTINFFDVPDEENLLNFANNVEEIIDPVGDSTDE